MQLVVWADLLELGLVAPNGSRAFQSDEITSRSTKQKASLFLKALEQRALSRTMPAEALVLSQLHQVPPVCSQSFEVPATIPLPLGIEP